MNEIRKCEICGITSDIKRIKYSSAVNMTLCSKHNNQYRTYGKFLDCNQQSRKDPNKYTIHGDYTEIYTYDYKGDIEETFIIDTEDLSKVLEHKWRTCYKRGKAYIVTGNNKQYPITYLARYLLDYSGELEVDHIDGNTLNNRKSNLRIGDRTVQCGNLAPRKTNKIGVRGVAYDPKNDVYIVDFSFDKHRYYTKPWHKIEEAVYARYMMETKLNPYRYTSNDEKIHSFIDNMSLESKKSVEDYLSQKLNIIF